MQYLNMWASICRNHGFELGIDSPDDVWDELTAEEKADLDDAWEDDRRFAMERMSK